MNEYLEEFENLLDAVISNENSEGFEEFKKKVIERLNEID
jgi:hypothetical protein